MTIDWTWLMTLLLPRDAVWWRVPVMTLLVALVAAALLTMYYPMRIPGELPGGEQDSVRRPVWRWLQGLMPLAAVGLLTGLYVLIANLSSPGILVLRRPNTLIAPNAAARAKSQWPGWRQIDARAIVNRALRAIETKGGKDWSSPQGQFVKGVREQCRESLRQYFQQTGIESSSASGELPAWIVECVEISVVDALLALEKIPAAYLDVARRGHNDPWDLFERSEQHDGADLSIEEEPRQSSPIIRLLFSGSVDSQRHEVHAQALVEAQEAGSLALRVVDASNPSLPAHKFTATVTAGTHLLPIQTKLSHTDASGNYWLISDQTGVSTPLTMMGASARTSLCLAMPPGVGDNTLQAGLLLQAWRRQLDRSKSQLAENLTRRGQALTSLEYKMPGAADPTLVVLPDQRGLLVLAPTLRLDDVPRSTYADDFGPVVHPGTTGSTPSLPVPSFGFHAITASGSADTDSLMSVGVETQSTPAGQLVLPRTDANQRILARGVRPNTTLESGQRAYYQHARPGGELAVYPLLEMGEVDGRPFVLLRLSPAAHLTDDATVVGQSAEQSRERAIVASLVEAANQVTQGAKSNAIQAQQRVTEPVRGFPVLSTSEVEKIRRTAQRRGDALGTILISICLAVFGCHAWLYRG
jgi:hypothetical protein